MTGLKKLKKYFREHQVKNESPSFVSRKGNPVSSRQLDRLMKHYADKAKLSEDKAHWHTLKHSIAVHLAESGADVKELQKYPGHKKLTAPWYIFSSPQSSRMLFIIRLPEALRLLEHRSVYFGSPGFCFKCLR
jgi:site-specific recombinase XerC